MPYQSDPSQSEILLVGDVHGSDGAMRVAFRTAKALGIVNVVQLGDFGAAWPDSRALNMWPHCRFTEAVSRDARKHGCHLTVLLGNHEGLWGIPQDQWNGHYDNVTFLGRSGVFEIDGHPIGYQAGGVSIDRNRRTPFLSYWRNEMPEMADVDAITRKADVFLSHDSAVLCPHLTAGTLPVDIEADCVYSRQVVIAGLRKCEASLNFHGHLHVGYSMNQGYGFTQVGLANVDATWSKSMVRLNLDTLAWEFVKVG